MHTVSPKEKSEARNTNAKWTRFCETILREGGFAKPRLIFLKFGGIRASAPQEGAGGMRGGDFGFLRGRALRKNIWKN